MHSFVPLCQEEEKYCCAAFPVVRFSPRYQKNTIMSGENKQSDAVAPSTEQGFTQDSKYT